MDIKKAKITSEETVKDNTIKIYSQGDCACEDAENNVRSKTHQDCACSIGMGDCACHA